jgi:tRNA pseudouridine38-40 synthase
MRRLKVVLEYDGTGFSGWQSQTNGRTVQDELEKALQELLQEHVSVTGSGRTDAGVHARGQVCHFDTENSMTEKAVARGLNGLLPRDIVIRSVEEMSSEFHARYSALDRTYRYYISQVPTALGRKQRWFVGHPLDIDAMQKCADVITGEHDFQAFCKVDSSARHYRCSVTSALWERCENDVVFEITSNRFLYGMVRALVGTMVEVGRGKLSKEDFVTILHSKERKRAASAAPPSGLVLEAVRYA